MSKRGSNSQTRFFFSAESPENIGKATRAWSGANSNLTAKRINANAKSSSETESKMGSGSRPNQRNAQVSTPVNARRETPTPSNLIPCFFNSSQIALAILCLRSATTFDALTAEMLSLAAAADSAGTTGPPIATGSAHGATRHRLRQEVQSAMVEDESLTSKSATSSCMMDDKANTRMADGAGRQWRCLCGTRRRLMPTSPGKPMSAKSPLMVTGSAGFGTQGAPQAASRPCARHKKHARSSNLYLLSE